MSGSAGANNGGGTVASASGITSPGELLSRRCVALIRTALKPDVWPPLAPLELPWLDKVNYYILISKLSNKFISLTISLIFYI